jgi:hypothetical protein
MPRQEVAVGSRVNVACLLLARWPASRPPERITSETLGASRLRALTAVRPRGVGLAAVVFAA